ncbi:tetratricopeptide repeat protein [Nitrosopumilus sp.]|uniref:tetratricopeptide repeat protein n=1 Tax=Nitrosopumilus sp. TaxID=2024843 RepID=UPI003B5918DC
MLSNLILLIKENKTVTGFGVFALIIGILFSIFGGGIFDGITGVTDQNKVDSENIEDVKKDLRKILKQLGIEEELNPNNSVDILKEEQEEIENLFKNKIPVDSEFLLLQGNYFYHLKDYNRSIQNYDKILDHDKNSFVVLNNKGLALDSLGLYEEAIVWYDKALEIEPNYVNTLNNKGLALYNLGLYEEAIVWYDKALEIEPNHVVTIGNKGLTLSFLGLYEEAIVWYDKALEIEPNHVVILDNKNIILQILKNS